MNVSISKIVEQEKAFTEKQNEQLRKFVEISKQIKLSANFAEQNAGNQFEQDKTLIDSVRQAQGTVDQNILEALTQNSDYVEQLEHIHILLPHFNQPNCSIEYIDTQQNKIDHYIEDKLTHEST